MARMDEDFAAQLLAMFRDEAGEHIKTISAGLLELERTDDAEARKELVETVFREAHSLKGAARAVERVEIEGLCRALESVFARLKSQEIPIAPELFDALHETLDTIPNLLESPAVEHLDVGELVGRLECLAEAGRPVEAPEPGVRSPATGAHADGEGRDPGAEPAESGTRDRTPEGPPRAAPRSPGRADPCKEAKTLAAETVRIQTGKLDSVLRQAEELLSVKLMCWQRVSELREATVMVDMWRKESPKLHPELQQRHRSMRPSGLDSQTLAAQTEKMSEALERNQENLRSLSATVRAIAERAERDSRSVAGIVDNLLEDSKKLLLMPFSALLSMFPKVVRDLSRDLGKEVDLTLEGGDVEIDKRILEEMKDPLIHVIRNCMDHGIEGPDERRRQNKPPRATVSISVSQVGGNKVEILVSDDGRGIHADKLRESAVSRGVLTRDEAGGLTEQEALGLIFKSGISTSEEISDISGRGLGLPIVRERVDKLGGSISLRTRLGEGTSFRILLPLTLATFRGILTRAADRVFVVPTTGVERVVRVRKEEVGRVGGREAITLHGRTVPLVHLADVLQLARQETADNGREHEQVLILAAGDQRIGFKVDEVLQEQEVLVKSLGRQLLRVPNIAGATVLGSGEVAPVLNVGDLLGAAVSGSGRESALSRDTSEDEIRVKSILVVEDSITSRTLLKNVLDADGYSVKTAVDGADAWAALKTNEIDLVVTDVEMPRMNGFELTEKIRDDEVLSDMPVVLVTSLDSHEDRERGVDAGANAYIVKSGFSQDNLLQTIRELI
ncbi:MAG: response regulator [Candidatus Krumholzibacteriia bacterium]